MRWQHIPTTVRSDRADAYPPSYLPLGSYCRGGRKFRALQVATVAARVSLALIARGHAARATFVPKEAVL